MLNEMRYYVPCTIIDKAQVATMVLCILYCSWLFTVLGEAGGTLVLTECHRVYCRPIGAVELPPLHGIVVNKIKLVTEQSIKV